MGSNESEINAWLEAHTFSCEGLRARITPEQCEINRSLPLLDDPLPRRMSAYAGRFRPGPCETCEKNPERTIKVRKPQRAQAPGGDGVKVKKECKRCKTLRPIQGRGLCGTCFYQVRKAGELDQWPPLDPSRAARIKEGIAAKKLAGAGEKKGPVNDGICGEACPQWYACKDLKPGNLPDSCPKLGRVKGPAGGEPSPGRIELRSDPAPGITIVINITAPAGQLCDVFMDQLKNAGSFARALKEMSK